MAKINYREQLQSKADYRGQRAARLQIEAGLKDTVPAALINDKISLCPDTQDITVINPFNLND